MTLEQLRKDRSRIIRELNAIDAAIQAEQVKQCGIAVGAILTDKKGRKWSVVGHCFSGCDGKIFYFKSSPQKKDGTFSSRTSTLWADDLMDAVRR